jgi:WD40 repeat protein
MALPPSKFDTSAQDHRAQMNNGRDHRLSPSRWVAAVGVGRAFRYLSALASVLCIASGAAHASVWVQIDAQSHAAPLMRIAADVRRDVVVTASDDKTVRVWGLSDGRAIAVLRPPVGPGRVGRMFGAAIHPTLDVIAIAGTGSAQVAPGPSIWLFELSTGRFLRRFDARGEHVRRLAWMADGRVLLACYGEPGAMRAFDVEGALLFEETLGGDCLGLGTHDLRIAAATRDREVQLYRVDGRTVSRTGRFATPGDPLSVRYSPDGTRLAIGYFTPGAGASIHMADTGAQLVRLVTPQDVLDPPTNAPISKTQAVAWSSDGRTVTTGGSLDVPGRTEGRIRRFDATSGRVLADIAVAEDTVTDLVELPPEAKLGADAVAWASFAGAWGVSAGTTSSVRTASRIDFLIRRGASELMVSPDAGQVRWARGSQREPVSFELSTRRVGPGDTARLRPAITRRGMFDIAQNFENHYDPQVRNQRVSLAPGEVSRALTYIGGDGHVVIATDLGIRRLDGSLRVVWEVRTATEVRAVNATEDGRLLVTTMSDGTVRWWRADNGTLLLSLLATREGWVLWTPTGHYDASHGAETLIGWLVDRDDSPLPDYFTVARFRDRFHRPDVIDRVLDTLDPAEAVRRADADRGTDPNALASISRPSVPVPGTTIAAPTAPPAPVDLIRPTEPISLPPVLGPLEPLRIAATDAPRTFRYTLRTTASPEAVRIEVRLDGKLVDTQRVSLPARLDGANPGEVTVPMAAGVQTVQVVARTGELASEPLRFKVDGDRVRVIEPARPTGTLYVLAVGVGRYRDSQITLQLPAKDARDFVEAMARQRGALYRDVVARVLVDAEATREGVVRGLAWLRETVTNEDVGIVFLAGHGVNDRAGHYHFLPVDFDRKRIDTTTVTGTTIVQALAAVRGRAVMFMDTCFAGTVTDTLSNVSRETAGLANRLSAPENSVSVFASSTGRQESFELGAWGNGAFTKIAVEGLTGGAKLTAFDVVTMRSLSPFLADGVSRLTEGKQTPVAVIPDVMPDRILSALKSMLLTPSTLKP